MLIEERQQKLRTLIRKNQSIATNDLLNMMNISVSTLRRDLDALEKSGKVRRVHGGVESLEDLTGRTTELTVAQKSQTNKEGKELIAKCAKNLITGGNVIFLDAGTTTGELISYLTEVKPTVTVVTNSVHHAAKLSDMVIPVIIVGGLIKQTTDAAIGSVAAKQISQLAFDISFLGTNGVSAEYGFTTPDPEEAALKSLVLQRSKKSYVLADSSKIDKVSFAKASDIQDATLVVDQLVQSLSHKLREFTQVIIAKEEEK
jgi:DeoR family fructose operon transcriptional repressor